MNIKGHFETITRHKLLVMKYCFECGLYEQGLAHDLSKYSPTEFIPGCIYYQGDHSPNEAERAAKGYTSAWLHHKGRNKHHLEYWIDYSTTKTGLTGMKIPLRYVCEMVCDRVAASQIYLGDKYTDASAWEYYQRSKDHYLMHPETRALLEKLLCFIKFLIVHCLDSVVSGLMYFFVIFHYLIPDSSNLFILWLHCIDEITECTLSLTCLNMCYSLAVHGVFNGCHPFIIGCLCFFHIL